MKVGIALVSSIATIIGTSSVLSIPESIKTTVDEPRLDL
jgi:hypothetical protein